MIPAGARFATEAEYDAAVMASRPAQLALTEQYLEAANPLEVNGAKWRGCKLDLVRLTPLVCRGQSRVFQAELKSGGAAAGCELFADFPVIGVFHAVFPAPPADFAALNAPGAGSADVVVRGADGREKGVLISVFTQQGGAFTHQCGFVLVPVQSAGATLRLRRALARAAAADFCSSWIV